MSNRKIKDNVEIYLSVLIGITVVAFSFLIPGVFWSYWRWPWPSPC